MENKTLGQVTLDKIQTVKLEGKVNLGANEIQYETRFIIDELRENLVVMMKYNIGRPYSNSYVTTAIFKYDKALNVFYALDGADFDVNDKRSLLHMIGLVVDAVRGVVTVVAPTIVITDVDASEVVRKMRVKVIGKGKK